MTTWKATPGMWGFTMKTGDREVAVMLSSEQASGQSFGILLCSPNTHVRVRTGEVNGYDKEPLLNAINEELTKMGRNWEPDLRDAISEGLDTLLHLKK